MTDLIPDLFPDNQPLNSPPIKDLSYWDLWMLIVLVGHFNGNWDAFIDHLKEKLKTISFDREKAEGLLNHLRCLCAYIDAGNPSPAEILSRVDPAIIKANRAKAKRKVLDMQVQYRERSIWMIETPRKQRFDRAMHGYWDQFPISPAIFTADIAAIFKPGKLYEENESFRLERRLTAVLLRLEKRADLPTLFALYRAYLTVLLDKINQVDDSYGVIGQGYEDVFQAYYQLDRLNLAMPVNIFFQDLLELIIWEDQGFTNDKQSDFFASLAEHEVPTIETILLQQWHELSDLELPYQAEEALTLLGLLYAQQKMFDRYVEIARQMGTRAWQRITRLADMAEKHQHFDLAVAVYEACLGPGMQENYLRKKYAELQERIKHMG
jgi:hypothetical protein